MNKFLISFSLLLSFFSTPSSADNHNAAGALVIENPWIAEAPPVSKVMVAYMEIKNNSTEDLEIVRAESDTYSSIEFHETKYEDGMARMIRHGSLEIPANSRIQLKRGAKHLMLFNPKTSLKAGDTVTIQFTINNNTRKSITVPVKKSQF